MRPPLPTPLPEKPLAFMLHALKPFWVLLGLALMTVVMGASAEGLQPYLIKLLVDTFGAATDIHAPAVLHRAIVVGLGFLGLRLLIVSIWWCYNLCRSRMEPHAEAAVRNTLLEELFRHSYTWFISGFAGRTGQRVDTVARTFRDLFFLASDDLVYVVVRGVTVLGLLITTDIWLGIGMIGWVAIAAPISIKMGKIIEKRSFEWIAVCGRYAERVVDMCANIFSVRSNGGARTAEQAYCAEMAENIRREHGHVIRTWRYISATRTSLNTLLYMMLFTLGFWRWQMGAISIGAFAMTMSVGITMVDLLDNFFKKTQLMSQIKGMLREALEGLLSDLPLLAVARENFRPGKGEIQFRNVTFSYRAQTPVVKDFSLDIAAGEKVALVGASGAGKSTLVSLLLGLWEADKGTILVDGQDITKTECDSLLRMMAVIPQDTSLFHRNLYDNIAYGSTDATQASVEEAARTAHIHDFIMQLPQGYATLVGERGLKLSGGQRQRIAVARAVHKKAPILLLDEATSALDSESEHAIQGALHKLIPEKTVLAIAHRLSTIAHMDRIVVMEAGRILEQGTHAELLSSNGRYARLWSMQSGGYLPEPDKNEADENAEDTGNISAAVFSAETSA